MTNKEKFPKTEDALAAFKKHKEECKCDCTFDLWLKMPCDEKVLSRNAMMMVGLAGLSLFDALSKRAFGGKDEEAKSNGDNSGDIECPFCHGKRGKIGGTLTNMFYCPDCGALIRCDKSMSLADWLSRFSKKQDQP